MIGFCKEDTRVFVPFRRMESLERSKEESIIHGARKHKNSQWRVCRK